MKSVTEQAPDFEACLRDARAGSPDALGRALESFRRYLLQIAREEIDAALRAKGGASDLVQETFLEASRDFGLFHGRSAPELRAWLRVLLLRRVGKLGRRFRHTRKRAVGSEVALDEARHADADRPTPSEAYSAGEERDRLHRVLDRLPEDYRQVVRLRYQEGRSFEEIGARMGRTGNAVRLLWLRAIERVRHELGGAGDA